MTAIRAPEASFARPVTSTLNPIRDGLVGEFVLGGDAATSRRNLANRPAAGVVNGSPVYGPDSVTFANSSGQSLDTGVKAAMNDVTIICVTRGLGSGNGEIVGAFPPLLNLSFYRSDNTFRFNNGSTGNPPASAGVGIPGGSTDFWTVFAWGEASGVPLIAVGVNGTTLSSGGGNAAGGARSLTETFKIAPNFGIGALQSETAYLAIYDRILTARERLEAYKAIRSGYAGLLSIA